MFPLKVMLSSSLLQLCIKRLLFNLHSSSQNQQPYLERASSLESALRSMKYKKTLSLSLFFPIYMLSGRQIFYLIQTLLARYNVRVGNEGICSNFYSKPAALFSFVMTALEIFPISIVASNNETPTKLSEKSSKLCIPPLEFVEEWFIFGLMYPYSH